MAASYLLLAHSVFIETLLHPLFPRFPHFPKCTTLALNTANGTHANGHCLRLHTGLGVDQLCYVYIDYIMSHLPHISSQGCGVCSAVAATAHVCFVPPFLTEFQENAAKKEIHKKNKTKRISLLLARASLTVSVYMYIFYLFMLLLLLLTLLGLSHYFRLGFYL